MLVLDTDHLSVLEHESEAAERLRIRLRETPDEEIVATIISFEEQMRGWMAYLARNRNLDAQVESYRRLMQHLGNYRTINLLGFDEMAAAEFRQLKKAKPRMGVMDLKIASIVLSHRATLLSRNLRDFKQIPGLQVDDWTA